MTPARRSISALAVVGTLALVAAGCGGADPAMSGTGTGTTPTTDPGATAPGTTVGGTPTGGAATGAPNTGGVIAKVPELNGGSLRGKGLSGVGGGLFSPLAAEASDSPDVPTTPNPTPLPTTPSPQAPETPTPSVVFTGATIYVDGMTYEVVKGDSFPTDDPLFRLKSVTANAIELELVAGEFTDGGGTGAVLDKGDLVSLLNASEQKTYKVKYVRPATTETGGELQ